MINIIDVNDEVFQEVFCYGLDIKETSRFLRNKSKGYQLNYIRDEFRYFWFAGDVLKYLLREEDYQTFKSKYHFSEGAMGKLSFFPLDKILDHNTEFESISLIKIAHGLCKIRYEDTLNSNEYIKAANIMETLGQYFITGHISKLHT